MYLLWLFVQSDRQNITPANSKYVGNLHVYFDIKYIYIYDVCMYDKCMCRVCMNVCMNVKRISTPESECQH